MLISAFRFPAAFRCFQFQHVSASSRSKATSALELVRDTKHIEAPSFSCNAEETEDPDMVVVLRLSHFADTTHDVPVSVV